MSEEYFLFTKGSKDPVPNTLYSLEEGVTLIKENAGDRLEYHETGNWDDYLTISIIFNRDCTFQLDISSTDVEETLVASTTQQIKLWVDRVRDLFLDGELEDVDIAAEVASA